MELINGQIYDLFISAVRQYLPAFYNRVWLYTSMYNQNNINIQNKVIYLVLNNFLAKTKPICNA